MMPFVDFAPEISFEKPIDSIAVSGHKMLGCPMPCGVSLCRKEHVERVEQHIAYLNSSDTTIMGSRNGQAALYMWYSLRKKGVEGIKRDVM
jgi:histidine decarboxylase